MYKALQKALEESSVSQTYLATEPIFLGLLTGGHNLGNARLDQSRCSGMRPCCSYLRKIEEGTPPPQPILSSH